MNNPDLIQCENDLSLANRAASLWLKEAAAASGRAPFSVALSGGRIAERFFSSVAEQALQKKMTLGAIDFFWADERGVAPTDPESNFALADRVLLTPLAVPRERIHRIRGEMTPDLAAAEAEADLCQRVPLNQGGQPILDLVLLGMGEDGHIASLFPGEADELVHSQRVYRAVIAPKPPPRRVTLNYAPLGAARKVWVLASGPGKEEALGRSLTEPCSTPLARLLSLREATTIFTDLRV